MQSFLVYGSTSTTGFWTFWFDVSEVFIWGGGDGGGGGGGGLAGLPEFGLVSKTACMESPKIQIHIFLHQ